jgi:hypothetical protein
LLTVLPLFLKITVDRGLRDGFEYTVSSLIQGSWAFNVFTMATKGYNYARALIFGQAQYIGTERGYVLQNASMVVLYGLYAKSHLYQGLELFVYLLLFHTYTSLPKSRVDLAHQSQCLPHPFHRCQNPSLSHTSHLSL